MGDVRALGVGGGVLRLELAARVAPAGGALAGKVVFVAGKRPEQVRSLTLRLYFTDGASGAAELDIVPVIDLSGPFVTEPGRTYGFPFSLTLASTAHQGPTRPGQRYALQAVADIPGAIDARSELEVEILPAACAIPY
jgi:hypothetical protein